MPSLRLLFMGTPAFALPSLEALHGSEHLLAAVVTRPDRPRDRGGRISPAPVKIWAKERGIAVEQPRRLEDPLFLSRLKELNPDLVVTAAFGRILPREILDCPSFGCINLHASLLPAYRGAAPIQRAVMAGESETGVTVIRMAPELDAGDIILQQREPVGPEETAGELHDRLAQKGASLLLEAVNQLSRGEARPVPQDPARASYAPPIGREEEKIDWRSGAVTICNRIRGMNPHPGAYTTFNGKRLKIWKTLPKGAGHHKNAGVVIAVDSGSITVAASDGRLELLEVQPQGKSRMSAGSFASGYRITPGKRFGT